MSRRSGKDDFDIFTDIEDLDEDDLSFDDFSDDLPEDDLAEDMHSKKSPAKGITDEAADDLTVDDLLEEPFLKESFEKEPFDQEPYKEEPYEEDPYEEDPFAEETFDDDSFTEDSFTEKPFKFWRGKGKTAKEKSGKEKSAKEKSAKEKPAGEKSVREKPDIEEPDEELSVTERPVRERPVKEKPARTRQENRRASSRPGKTRGSFDDLDDFDDLAGRDTLAGEDDFDDLDDLDNFDDLNDRTTEYMDDQPFDDGSDERPARQRQSREVNRRRTSSIKKSSPLDDFREWLSDYLIYFMLGGVVLIILLVVIFAVRGCGKKEEAVPEDEETTTTIVDPGTSPEEEVVEITNPLMPAESGIVSLVNERFAALASGNTDAVRALQTDLSAVDEAKIISDSDKISSYVTKDVYTKEGMEEGSYVTYVSFDINYAGYDTPDPSLDELYVITTGDGNFIVNTDAQSNPDIVAYTSQLWEDSDLKELLASVKSAHDQALSSDPELASFLAGQGEEVTADPGTPAAAVEDDGSGMTTTATVNMRSEPSGDIIGEIPEGTSVKVLGKAGENLDWYQVDYNGQTGYVYYEYLSGGSIGASSDDYSEDDDEDYYYDDEYY